MNQTPKKLNDAKEAPTTIDEKKLVKQAQQGDLQAYTQLMEHYHSRIYGMIYNMTSNKEDTEDLIQEVFIKAHQVIDKFQGRSTFYTWVYRIGVNRTLNFLQKRNRRRALSLNEIDHGVERDEHYIQMSSKNSPARDATLSELQQKLNAALQTLSEKHRIVVVLHDIQGISHDKIAEMIGVSAGTARSRLFYARKQLQAELAEYAS